MSIILASRSAEDEKHRLSGFPFKFHFVVLSLIKEGKKISKQVNEINKFVRK